MFRRFMILLGLIMFPVCLMTAGCSNAPDPNAIPGGESLQPKDIVDRLFAAFQFNDMTGAEKYFSSEMPGKVAKGFINDFSKTHAIAQFKTQIVSSNKTNAVVKVIYSYDRKDAKTGEITSPKKIVELKQMELVREDKYWKIRRTGFDKYDMKVEESLFYKCLNTVMDITIAEEKLHQRRPTYSNSMMALEKVYPIDESACADIRIEQQGKTAYWVIAHTRNYVPCEITGNTDKHSPAKFEECPGQ
jgi:hypothetical protein